jgi:hypothetical protein
MVAREGEGPHFDPAGLGPHFKFTRNPYDPSPLAVSEVDSSLFIGRRAEATILRTMLSSFDSGGVFVEGGIGVGKTSFVNVQQFLASRKGSIPRVLPSLHPLQLELAPTPVEFLLSVLSNVLNALRQFESRSIKNAAFIELSAQVDQTLVKTRSYQATVAGTGGGYGTSVTTVNPSIALLPSVSRRLDECAELVGEFGFKTICVAVNNLDIVPEDVTFAFLNEIRDLTLTRRPFFWVFVGPLGIRSSLSQRSRRVSELVRSEPIALQPLSKEEVHAVLAARARLFRLSPRVEIPIDEQVVDLLYEASKGEVRYILNRCTDLLVRTMLEFPTAGQVSLAHAMPLLREITKSAIDRLSLTPRQKSILEQIAKKGMVQSGDYRELGLKSPQALSKYLLRFSALLLLDRRSVGREVVYVPRGDVAIALGTHT